jgi:hypothetical protein
MEEVTMRAAQKVLVEVDDSSTLIFGNPWWDFRLAGQDSANQFIKYCNINCLLDN